MTTQLTKLTKQQLNSSWQICSYKQTPLFAMQNNAPNWLFKRALNSIPGNSYKRWLFKQWKNLISNLPNNPALKTVEFSRLAQQYPVLNQTQLRTLLTTDFWHLNFRYPNDSKRCYLTTYDNASHQAQQFIKLAWDKVNQDALNHEYHNIQQLKQYQITEFSLPEVINFRQGSELSLLSLQYLPRKHLQNLHYSNFLSNYNKVIWQHFRQELQLESQPWWHKFNQQATKFPKLANYFDAHKVSKYSGCLAHSDFSGAHIIKLSKQPPIIIDWEHMSYHAPYLSDTICYLSYDCNYNNINKLRTACQSLGYASATLEQDLLLAIAYLTTINSAEKPHSIGGILAATI